MSAGGSGKMDSRLQFGRYNKDSSVNGLRVRLARRKSISQKENRHNAFRKSRDLRLLDPNTSVLERLHTVEELSETSLAQGHENFQDLGKTIIKEGELERRKQRYNMLQRYKEEKLLRKLKEQRDKAQKGAFRCGVYKHDDSVMSLPSTKHASKPKADKQAPPTTRVTRSAVKNEAPPPQNTRRQPITAGASNVTTDAATRGHALKTAEKENHGLPPVRITRATAARVLPENTNVAVKLQKRNRREPRPQEIPPNPEVSSRIPVTEGKAGEASEPMKSDSAMEPPRERIRSFAPENFTFQPLDGLWSYKPQPTTPATDRPQSFRWSPPRAPCDTMQDAPQDAPQDPIQVCEAQPPSCNEVTSPTRPPTTATAEEFDVQTPAGEPQHDVPYFRAALKAEIQRLTLLCTQWDERIGMEIPDEAKDLIRTTVGQTRLLVAERFKQFEGLVDNCEFKRGEKETTCTDLDGFWDMVYFQIEDVIQKFSNLVKLEENLWRQSTVQPNKAVKKRIAPAVTVNRGEEARAAARSRLAAIKAAMKKGKVSEDPAEAADQTPQAAVVVFDAGFFRVESPAKRPGGVKPNCGSPQTSALCQSNMGAPRAAPTFGSEDGSDGGSRLARTPGIKSPVGRTLFGDREEDGRTELENCEHSPRPATTESELAKAENPVKLLVPPEECNLSFGSPKSFEVVTHSETRMRFRILSSGEIEDKVFMSDMEEMEQQTHRNSPVPEDVQSLFWPHFAHSTCRGDLPALIRRQTL
uniref:DLG associated protein 5 n=1 Tax=Leptobrachium leishanense TaxID=445787 RepID=A0A8C5MW39_9ANUR